MPSGGNKFEDFP